MKLTYLFIIFCCLQSVGCSQIANFQQYSRSVNLGQYYQWLKSLDKEQLASEIAHQQNRKAQKNPEAELYVLLLHSLPASSIYNPYTAKSMLNDNEFNEFIYSNVSASDLAFVTLLRDQLNQQLLQLQANDKQKKQNQQKLAQLSLQLKMHQKEVEQLSQQLSQLKAIETQLSTRENR